MKILQNLAVESDWGRFVYFSRNAGTEHFSWKDEVGDISKEKQKDRNTFYARLGKDKQTLQKEIVDCSCLEGREMEFDNRLLSIQLAELFSESTKEWSVKNHRKTFDALNRLTKLGYNVDKPSGFRGLKLVIHEDNVLEIHDKTGAVVSKEIAVSVGDSSGGDVVTSENAEGVTSRPSGQLTSDKIIEPEEEESSPDQSEQRIDILARNFYIQRVFEKIAQTTSPEENNALMREAMRVYARENQGGYFRITTDYGEILTFPKKEDTEKTIVLFGSKEYEFSKEELTGEWKPKYTNEQLQLNEVGTQTAVVGEVESADSEKIYIESQKILLTSLKKKQKKVKNELRIFLSKKEEIKRWINLMNVNLQQGESTMMDSQKTIMENKIAAKKRILEDMNSGIEEKRLSSIIEVYQERIEEVEKSIPHDEVIEKTVEQQLNIDEQELSNGGKLNKLMEDIQWNSLVIGASTEIKGKGITICVKKIDNNTVEMDGEKYIRGINGNFIKQKEENIVLKEMRDSVSPVIKTPKGTSMRFLVENGEIVERPGKLGYASFVRTENGKKIVTVHEDGQKNDYFVKKNAETNKWELILKED